MVKKDQKSNYFMNEAILCAKNAFSQDEVPVGAVVTKAGSIIGRGWNRVVAENSVISHAEINAICNASSEINNYRLIDCDLYVTLEPCHMCAKAIINARIKNVFFSTPEPKAGAIISVDNFFDKSFINHRVNYSCGLMQQESSELLKNFFQQKRI